MPSWSRIGLQNQADHDVVQDRGFSVPVAHPTLRFTEGPPGIPAMFRHCVFEDMMDHLSYTHNLSSCEINA